MKSDKIGMQNQKHENGPRNVIPDNLGVGRPKTMGFEIQTNIERSLLKHLSISTQIEIYQSIRNYECIDHAQIMY